MSYRLEFVSSASREFLALPATIPGTHRQTARQAKGLRENPSPSGVKALRGQEGFWRIRVGGYRIVYQIDDRQRLVTVTRVRPRASVYRGL